MYGENAMYGAMYGENAMYGAKYGESATREVCKWMEVCNLTGFTVNTCI